MKSLIKHESIGMTAFHRARLLDTLVEHLPGHVNVYFGQRATSVRQTKEKVYVTFDHIAPGEWQRFWTT
jgi:2-polyprenyl-6-methoxyphenol hydroxylase-like FAD-dependent oxidoreductase